MGAFRFQVLAVLLATRAFAGPGDGAYDQFFRYVEVKNKTVDTPLPGETVDRFTGTLRIVQEDLSLPGKAGLDLKILRTYSSKIWSRSDALSIDPLIADVEPTPVGFGWNMHLGRVRNPNATGMPGACGAPFHRSTKRPTAPRARSTLCPGATPISFHATFGH